MRCSAGRLLCGGGRRDVVRARPGLSQAPGAILWGEKLVRVSEVVCNVWLCAAVVTRRSVAG